MWEEFPHQDFLEISLKALEYRACISDLLHYVPIMQLELRFWEEGAYEFNGLYG